jgi:ElaB/YqjD/DUF883 family membrane-anchored ribosome-binding protein
LKPADVVSEFINGQTIKENKMSKHKNGIQESAGILVDDTRALLAATAECAEDTVIAARERVSDALDKAKDTYVAVQKSAAQGVKAADKAIRAKPYQAVGIAFGVGVLLEFLVRRRN